MKKDLPSSYRDRIHATIVFHTDRWTDPGNKWEVAQFLGFVCWLILNGFYQSPNPSWARSKPWHNIPWYWLVQRDPYNRLLLSFNAENFWLKDLLQSTTLSLEDSKSPSQFQPPTIFYGLSWLKPTVAGGFSANPSEKYAIGSFPQGSEWTLKIFELPAATT